MFRHTLFCSAFAVHAIDSSISRFFCVRKIYNVKSAKIAARAHKFEHQNGNRDLNDVFRGKRLVPGIRHFSWALAQILSNIKVHKDLLIICQLLLITYLFIFNSPCSLISDKIQRKGAGIRRNIGYWIFHSILESSRRRFQCALHMHVAHVFACTASFTQEYRTRWKIGYTLTLFIKGGNAWLHRSFRPGRSE